MFMLKSQIGPLQYVFDLINPWGTTSDVHGICGMLNNDDLGILTRTPNLEPTWGWPEVTFMAFWPWSKGVTNPHAGI